MKTHSESEENYIKALYHLGGGEAVSNGELAARVGAKGSSVTQAVKRLSAKGLVEVIPYRGVKLTASGVGLALHILRKHRLWETFLVDQLGFGWEQVHPIAEQLEHVQSPELVERLADFLGQPQHDPHGDPIPQTDGTLPPSLGRSLSQCRPGERIRVVRVEDAGKEFFRQLENLSIGLGATYAVRDASAFDGSVELVSDTGGDVFWLSSNMSKNIYVMNE